MYCWWKKNVISWWKKTGISLGAIQTHRWGLLWPNNLLVLIFEVVKLPWRKSRNVSSYIYKNKVRIFKKFSVLYTATVVTGELK